MESALPTARLVHLSKWASKEGYGFTVKEFKDKKEYRVKTLEADMPAAAAGIMANDCIIEVNGIPTSTLDYAGLVNEIKRNPQKVVLRLLQPYEKELIKKRGVDVTSKACPVEVVKGRRESDDTTKMVAEKMAANTVEKSLIRCDANTAVTLCKQRLDLLSSL
ncbi:unnamed protein product [Mesocestoides corti]|uniref:PDZ domain-containing protein n=1 Tax=Mesocestoides corti TaxID=53468 RepID=A0A0R3U234_MESCO|nr:unnamed protein product [Mesocestoides corti]